MVQHAILALFVSYVLSRIISATTYIHTYTYYSSYFASHPCISRNAARVSTLEEKSYFFKNLTLGGATNIKSLFY